MNTSKIRNLREIEIKLAELQGFYNGIHAKDPDGVKVLNQIEMLQWILKKENK